MDTETRKHLARYAYRTVSHDEIDSFTALAEKMYEDDPERIASRGWGLVLDEFLGETYSAFQAPALRDCPAQERQKGD